MAIGTDVAQIDALAVVKASQAVSSQIVLDPGIGVLNKPYRKADLDQRIREALTRKETIAEFPRHPSGAR